MAEVLQAIGTILAWSIAWGILATVFAVLALGSFVVNNLFAIVLTSTVFAIVWIRSRR